MDALGYAGAAHAPGKWRNSFLSFFGPLSVLVLIGAWAVGLIFGFALLQWSLGSQLRSPGEGALFPVYLYFSGVTFFTLGFGDVTPINPLGRFLAVAETASGSPSSPSSSATCLSSTRRSLTVR